MKLKKLTMYLVTGLIIANFVFAFAVTPVLAQGRTLTERFGFDYATQTGLGTADLRDAIMAVLNVLLGFLGIIAIIVILWGGFRWMTAGGNEDKVGEAKNIITAGVIGLVIILISYALVSFVITQIVGVTEGGAAL